MPPRSAASDRSIRRDGPSVAVTAGFAADALEAHAVNTVKMAEGFTACGCHARLILGRAQDGTPPDQLRLFGLRQPLPLTTVDNRNHHGWLFALQCLPRLLAHRPDLVFARNYAVPALGSGLGLPVVMETHAHVGDRTPWLLNACRAGRRRAFKLCVTISEALADYYCDLGMPREKLLVLPTGVNVDAFRPPEQLPDNPYGETGFHAVYVGHLYDYKGIPTILDAAGLAPEITFHLIGGSPEDYARTEAAARDRALGNVVLHGHKGQSELGRYLWHADALLLPPSARHPSARWTSPVKLGEYLASGRPVVATDIPALRAWLDDRVVGFVAPDDGAALAAGVRAVRDQPSAARARTVAGFSLARTWSYEHRARQILEHCGTNR